MNKYVGSIFVLIYSYHRFIKSKDLSSYTDTDMACILGQRPSQTAPATPQRDQSEVQCPRVLPNIGYVKGWGVGRRLTQKGVLLSACSI